MTNLEEIIEAQIAEHAAEHKDVDPCEALWHAVIDHALRDLGYLQRLEGRTDFTKHELDRLRRINSSPPRAFVAGKWFEEICSYLGLDPDRLRCLLLEHLERAA